MFEQVSHQLNSDRKVTHKAFIKIDKRIENSPIEGEHPPHEKQGKSQHFKAYEQRSARFS